MGAIVIGAHRAVSCHCGMATVSRQVLVEHTIEGLKAAFEPAPDGRPWFQHIMEHRPDLRERLRKALNV